AGGHRRDPFAGERTTTFADLLRRIHEEVPAIKRLRFVTSYPRDFGDDVLEVMRESLRICRYLHVPAQSGSNAVLARMNRGYTVEEYLEFIERARGMLHQPEIGRPLTIAGDLIAGFCGETETDHEATKGLLRRVGYKNCFIFKYSPRPGTTAFDRLPDDVPEEDKRRRVNELLAIQQGISDGISQSHVGSEVEVFVQGVSAREAKRQRVGGLTTGIKENGVTLTIEGRSADGTPCQEGACDPPTATMERRDHAGIVQLTARTEGDLIVVFDCPEGRSPDELIGEMIGVKIESATALTMFGRACL
ncbi:MAG TPA: radical SAM protein, partial [Phycisphaerales bacterium]|nr:radical SAM protein [Phycisphaerales bacterium]